MNPSNKNLQLLLDHVDGAMAIDMKGVVFYLNDQCASYLHVDREASIGKHVMEVFSETKMLEGLQFDMPRIVYYNTSFGLGISIHVPLFEQGEKVGLLEYDVIQGSQYLYDFSDDYRLFLDKEFKLLSHQIHLEQNKYTINDIVGQSACIQRLREEIAHAARVSSTVLITGETGTGKELVAHSLHTLSSRRMNPFVYVNASALPDNLIESELFGYEPGAFTGASREGKKGKFELAHTGTLLIDEIDQMSLHLQPKLLRAIQEREIDRVGGTKSIPVDIRILAATNKDLRQLVKEGKFREDLFFRLHVLEINTPPLRDHLEDIPALTKSIVEELNSVMGKRVEKVNPNVYDLFRSYGWPGNVRELRNVIERAMNEVESGELMSSHFRFKQVIFEGIGRVADDLLDQQSPIDEVRDYAERELLLRVLADCKGNKTQAAKRLKIQRPLLYKKMKRLQIGPGGLIAYDSPLWYNGLYHFLSGEFHGIQGQTGCV